MMLTSAMAKSQAQSLIFVGAACLPLLAIEGASEGAKGRERRGRGAIDQHQDAIAAPCATLPLYF
jgi:hypothetical protein